jgi:hypothetical protein
MEMPLYKADMSRYTIRFNPADPYHQKAMVILNHFGRRKASLIANAVCAYCEGGENALQSVQAQMSLPYAPQMQSTHTIPTAEPEISKDWVSISIMDVNSEDGDTPC